MLSGVFRVDQDIIKVNYASDVNKSNKCLINVGLEGGRGVRKPKREDIVLKVAVLGLKSSLLLVSFLNSKAIIYILKI